MQHIGHKLSTMRKKWKDPLASENASSDFSSLLAILGLALSITLTGYLTFVIGRPVYALIGVLATISCAAWILLKDRISLDKETTPQSKRTLELFFNFIFFVLMAISIILLYSRSESYERPMIYFVIMASLVSVVALETLFTSSSRKAIYLILFQIVLIGINLTFSQSLIFPSILGVDPWYHEMFTSKIIAAGYIPPGSAYSMLPIFHLEIAGMSIFTGLDYKLSSMFSVNLVQILIDTLLVFLLGKYLLNERVGVLAGLFLVTANYSLSMGFSPIPNTIGVVLALFILYLLIQPKGESNSKKRLLAFFFMLVLIMTHTIASAGLAICLFVGWIIFRFANKSLKRPVNNTITSITVIFFVLGMFSWWMYASGSFGSIVSLFQWGFSREPFITTPNEILTYAVSISDWEQIINWLGFLLFFAFSIFGIFFMISQKKRNFKLFAIAIIGVITLLLPFVSLITEHRVYEQRFWYLAQVLLSVPVGTAFLLNSSISNRRYTQAIVSAIVAFSMSFLMIISTTANMDNDQLSPDSNVRFALTDSEMHAIDFARQSDLIIATDFQYSLSMNFTGIGTTSVDSGLFSRNFTQLDSDLVFIRSEIVERPFWLFGAVWKLDYDPRPYLEDFGFSKCYDSGSVSSYIF